MTNQPTSRTDLRVLRTRRSLRDAFIELLQDMELEKISVNRIAERATVSRVTFYLHYRDIQDMLEKMADEMIGDIRGILIKRADNPTIEENWPIMVNLLEHIAENAKFYKVVLASKRTTIFIDRLLNLLTEMITERFEKLGSDNMISSAGVPKDIAQWYFSAALIGTIISWLENDIPYTPRFLAKQFFTLLPHNPN